MVSILADSISESTGIRVTSFLVDVPTIKLAEIRTHRKIVQSNLDICSNDTKVSINANSTRAISLNRYDELIDNPYVPSWTVEKKGMSGDLVNDDGLISKLNSRWFEWLKYSREIFCYFKSLKIHKQNTSIFLQPFTYTRLILTADEFGWRNFFKLRISDDVYPDIKTVAEKMKIEYDKSIPKTKKPGEWHIVFEELIEKNYNCKNIYEKLLISSSMCARISYNNDSFESIEKHIDRAIKCLKNEHLSIFEHQLKSPESIDFDKMEIKYINGKPIIGPYVSNVIGFVQLRKLIEFNQIDLTNVF